MAASVFGSRLDLLVRLYDTTTGAPVDERNVLFTRNEEPVIPAPRGEGMYVFINTGREDFLMQITVYGYEKYSMQVTYGELDDRIPSCDVFLIPSENVHRGESVLSFSGTLPFLEAIEAVKLSRPICMVKEFDAKKNFLSVYGGTGGMIRLDSVWYALLGTDKTSYERIEVTGSSAAQYFKIKDKIAFENVTNLPVYRVILGRVSENGDYLLRVRDDGEDALYLVRYLIKGEERFETVDFKDTERRLK
ncbi:MAG: hypothetical protein II966_00375 [Lachnospiraceae bacterium]|nr:hypothetical protein [Lachnospiraceae bacterium]